MVSAKDQIYAAQCNLISSIAAYICMPVSVDGMLPWEETANVVKTEICSFHEQEKTFNP